MHGPHGGRPHHWFRSGLRFFVLAVLSSGPKSGYEIAKELEARVGWRPSPGSLYPLLFKLEEAGLIRKNEQGLYELSEEGRYSVLGPAFYLLSPDVLLAQAELIVELLQRMKGEGVALDMARLERLLRNLEALLR